MSEAVILSACRTPIGKFRGSLSSVSATDLGACVVREAIARAGVTPHEVEEVILGMVLPAGTGQAPARQAALKAGLPATVGALTINKVCGSGLKAVMLAAQAIRAGDADVVVAGGMENMSQAPWLLRRDGPPLGDRSLIDSMLHDGLECAFSGQSMGVIADSLAQRAGISREAQDRYAVESHGRAVVAAKAGVLSKGNGRGLRGQGRSVNNCRDGRRPASGLRFGSAVVAASGLRRHRQCDRWQCLDDQRRSIRCRGRVCGCCGTAWP